MEDLFLKCIEQFGNLGIFFLIFIENVFPPIPSEVVLGMGGIFIIETNLTFISVLFSSTLGSIMGALVLYYIGRHLNSPNVRKYFIGEDKVLKLGQDKLEKIKSIYQKYERVSIFFLRMVPIFRSIISIPAGMFKMNILEFVILTGLGSLIWNSIIIYAGMTLGDNWAYIKKIINDYTLIVIALLLVSTTIYFFKKYRNKK
ncbi:MAG: DedA family protein [Lagierella massiliensis]|nr:DedA family protein [Lagierella massiliensis]